MTEDLCEVVVKVEPGLDTTEQQTPEQEIFEIGNISLHV
jgi:hypothetical protein